MLCVLSWLAPVPKIAQIYVLNLFLKIVFHFYIICLVIPKYTSDELITIL
jgi:hypothetical protein